MRTETPITWRTHPSELEPDSESSDPCGAIRCRRAVCDGECEPSRAQRARAVVLERERLERLAMRKSA